MTRLKDTSSSEAQLSYMELVRGWKVYGSTFFVVEPKSQPNLPNYGILAVIATGILIIDMKTRDITAGTVSYHIASLFVFVVCLHRNKTRQGKTRQDKKRHHNIRQRKTTQRSTAQHNTTQHNTAQHKATHETTQHKTQHSATQRNATQHNATQHNTTQHNTQHHSTQPNIPIISRRNMNK
jgi:hypothetical protein